MLCKKAHSPTQGLEFGVRGERGEGWSAKCPGYSLKDQIQAAQTDLDPWGGRVPWGEQARRSGGRWMKGTPWGCKRVHCRKCVQAVGCPHGGTLLSGEREKNPDTLQHRGIRNATLPERGQMWKTHIARCHFSKCPEQANLWRQRAGWRFPGARHGSWLDRKQAWGSFLGDRNMKKLAGSDGCTNPSICWKSLT